MTDSEIKEILAKCASRVQYQLDEGMHPDAQLCLPADACQAILTLLLSILEDRGGTAVLDAEFDPMNARAERRP